MNHERATHPRLRAACVNVEAERLRLNARWAIANSAARCLGHYLERYRRVRALRKASETG